MRDWIRMSMIFKKDAIKRIAGYPDDNCHLDIICC